MPSTQLQLIPPLLQRHEDFDGEGLADKRDPAKLRGLWIWDGSRL